MTLALAYGGPLPSAAASSGDDRAPHRDLTAQHPLTIFPSPLAPAIQAALAGLKRQGGADIDLPDLEAFYARRGYERAWTIGGGREAARVLVARMQAAGDDGLAAHHYDAEVWATRLETRTEPAAGRSLQDASAEGAILEDVALTAVLLRFASDLARGVRTLDSAREIDVVGVLAGVRDAESARAALSSLEPGHSEYRRLREGLRRYRERAARGGWRPLPTGVLLKRDGDPPDAGIVRLLCHRLSATGELPSGAGTCDPEAGGLLAYDASLEQAVRAFQARHGLKVDGIVGPRTVAALNVPVETRIAQLALNMDRWRRLPDDLGDTYVRVNIPGFRLHAVEADERALTMRIIAGRPDTPTPVFSDEISYLEFRPYWNVPESVMRSQLLPKIMTDPDYLRRRRFDVLDGWSRPARIVDPEAIEWEESADAFPYRLRQRPGSHNSLGLVKFMFPNNYSVYLHDTPARGLFERPARAFSAGCIRVEDPIALAAFLLRDTLPWSADAITAAMAGGGRQVVPLPERVPVHLTYFTAFVDDGLVHFRQDLYGLEEGDALPLADFSDG